MLAASPTSLATRIMFARLLPDELRVMALWSESIGRTPESMSVSVVTGYGLAWVASAS